MKPKKYKPRIFRTTIEEYERCNFCDKKLVKDETCIRLLMKYQKKNRYMCMECAKFMSDVITEKNIKEKVEDGDGHFHFILKEDRLRYERWISSYDNYGEFENGYTEEMQDDDERYFSKFECDWDEHC